MIDRRDHARDSREDGLSSILSNSQGNCGYSHVLSIARSSDRENMFDVLVPCLLNFKFNVISDRD